LDNPLSKINLSHQCLTALLYGASSVECTPVCTRTTTPMAILLAADCRVILACTYQHSKVLHALSAKRETCFLAYDSAQQCLLCLARLTNRAKARGI
jgi:uncharacterized membrane protein